MAVMKSILRATFFFAVTSLASCGGGDTDGCDFRVQENRCQERVRDVADPAGTVSAAFENTCEAAGGGFLADGCPADGRVAGCELSGAGAETVTDWFYAPATRDDVVRECEGDGTVVDP